jgi:hypothetical protein
VHHLHRRRRRVPREGRRAQEVEEAVPDGVVKQDPGANSTNS